MWVTSIFAQTAAFSLCFKGFMGIEVRALQLCDILHFLNCGRYSLDCIPCYGACWTPAEAAFNAIRGGFPGMTLVALPLKLGNSVCIFP